MALQGPKGVNFEGRGVNETAQIAGRASGDAKLLAVTSTTGSVILPVSSNGLPYAAYQLTCDGTDTVYWRLGAAAVTVDHVSDACDDALTAGSSVTISNNGGHTYIAGITASGTATLVIAGLV